MPLMWLPDIRTIMVSPMWVRCCQRVTGPRQRSMHFTQDEEQGVTLHYDDLDPEATYAVRFTFVRPWYQDRYAQRMNQKSQSIYADDV